MSPFGVILGGQPPQGSSSPFSVRSYFPKYLPPGMSIEIVQDVEPTEPALFWMPWLDRDRSRSSERIDHAVGVNEFSGLAIGLPDLRKVSPTARHLADTGLLSLFESPAALLHIHFRGPKERLVDCRPELPLVLGLAATTICREPSL